VTYVQAAEKRNLEDWAAFLGHAEIPVLARTGLDLAELRKDEELLSARNVSRVVLRDPLMTVKLLHYLQRHRHKRQSAEVIQVEQAVLMLGMDPFYNNIHTQPTVETLLQGHPDALQNLTRVIQRAQRAANYAIEWAIRLNDMHFDEVYIAALLHDLAELLLWCFAPQDMILIHDAQLNDKSLRSRAAQEMVLGFPISDLQLLLSREWSLPSLLSSLMDDAHAQQARVRNVVLAVNLARHSANGWDDAALPDDYAEIGDLLHLPVEQVITYLRPVQTGTNSL
jgi:HD-like signal output (HDOD) protein